MEYVKTSVFSKADLSYYLKLLSMGVRRDSLPLEGLTVPLPNTEYHCNLNYSDDSGAHRLVAELTWGKEPEVSTASPVRSPRWRSRLRARGNLIERLRELLPFLRAPSSRDG